MSTWIDEKDLLGQYGLPSDADELFNVLSQRGTKNIIRTGSSTLYELESIPKRIQNSLEKNGFTPIDPNAAPAQSASPQKDDTQDPELDWDDAIQESQNESVGADEAYTEPDMHSADMFSETETTPYPESDTPAQESVQQSQSDRAAKLTGKASASLKTQNNPITKQESSMTQSVQATTNTVNLEKTNMVLALLNLNDAEWREIGRQTFRRTLENADSATLMAMQSELVADMQAVTLALQSKITG